LQAIGLLPLQAIFLSGEKVSVWLTWQVLAHYFISPVSGSGAKRTVKTRIGL